MYCEADYLRFKHCPKYFEGLAHKQQPLFHILEMDNKLKELFSQYIGCVDPYRNLSINCADQILTGWYNDITIESKRISASISWMYVDQELITVYLLSLHTYPGVELRNEILVIEYILRTLTDKKIKFHFGYLNGKYRYNGNCYVPKQMFKKCDYLTNSNREFILRIKPMKQLESFEQELDEMDAIVENGVSEEVIACSKSHYCPFRSECDSSKVENYYQRLADNVKQFGLPKQRLTKIQYQCYLNQENYVNHKALRQWLSHIKEPCYFLDFEWERRVLPWVKKQGLCNDYVFEYSLAVVNGNTINETFTYIEETDNNLELLKSLIERLGNEGTIFAYNAAGAEKAHLLQFAKLYPEYSETIFKICDRIVSIDVPLNAGMIYHLDIKGSYSLKHIAHVISFKDYQQIELETGLDAVAMYRNYRQSLNPEDKKNLVLYCRADSLAMIYLLQWYRDNAYR